MKHLIRFVTLLYPAVWRERYEAEFVALLEDVKPSWRTTLNILNGALAMQLWTVTFGRAAALGGFVGLVLGLGVWVAIPNQYASEALVRIESPDSKDVHQYVSADLPSVLRKVFSNRSLGEIIKRYKLYPAQQTKTPLEDIVDQMKKSIKVAPAQDRSGRVAMALEFEYSDPIGAQQVTGELVNRVLSESVERAIDSPSLGRVTLRLLDVASKPKGPVSPWWVPLALVGTFSGLATGIAGAFLVRALKPA